MNLIQDQKQTLHEVHNQTKNVINLQNGPGDFL
jgi:hypothetical protein